MSEYVYLGRQKEKPHGHIALRIGNTILWKFPFIIENFQKNTTYDYFLLEVNFGRKDRFLAEKDCGFPDSLTKNHWDKISFRHTTTIDLDTGIETLRLEIYIHPIGLEDFKGRWEPNLLWHCKDKGYLIDEVSCIIEFNDKGKEIITQELIRILL